MGSTLKAYVKNAVFEKYLMWREVKIRRAIKAKEIREFADELYTRCDEKMLGAVPAGFSLKYDRVLERCYEQSLAMFLGIEEAVLVRADVLSLKLNPKAENPDHGWIEVGDLVMDPSDSKIYTKARYYQIEKPTNICKMTHEEYEKQIGGSYGKVWWKPEDYAPGGCRRYDLLLTWPMIEWRANLPGNEEMKKDFEVWVQRLQYDQEVISKELAEYVHTQLLREQEKSPE